MDKIMPHLVVQCGEKHVTPVSQALTKLLSGKGSAVFLPRYAFSAMTTTQVEKQFDIHQQWARSLKALPLAPFIFHLDQKRNEYYNDGTVIVRSTREWASTLKYSTGLPALCDVVNGTIDKKALLLAPAPYAETAQIELRQYRSRLSPPSHREARFRDKVPDLPDVIHIHTEIQSNVAFMESIYPDATWPACNESTPPSGDSRAKKTKTKTKHQKPKSKTHSWEKPPDIPKQGIASETSNQQNIATGDGHLLSTSLAQGDDRSTDSTQGITLASDTSFQNKLAEIESATKSKLQTLAETSRQSAARLQELEQHFQRFDAMDRKLGDMENTIKSVATQLDESVEAQQESVDSIQSLRNTSASQFNRVSDHLVTSGQNVNQLTDTVAEIRNEMSRVSSLLQELATQQYAQEIATVQEASPTSVLDSVSVCNTQMTASAHGEKRPTAQAARLRPPSPTPLLTPPQPLQSAAARVPLPDSSENSVNSGTSKQSSGSDSVSTTEGSIRSHASSIVRSPPSKRTRNSNAHHQSLAESSTTNPMDMDDINLNQDDVFNDDSEMFDAIINNAIRTNLEARFNDLAPSNSPSNNESLTSQRSNPPTASSAPSASTSPPVADKPPSPTAPLNPRNNLQMDSAGAGNK